MELEIDLDFKKIALNVFYFFLILTFFLLFKKGGIPAGLEMKFLITTVLFGVLALLLNYKDCLDSIKQFKNKVIKTGLNELLRERFSIPHFSFKTFEIKNYKTIILYIVSIGLMVAILNYYTQIFYYLIKAMPYLLLIYFIVSLKLKLDSRIPIALALGLLFLTAITLVRGAESSANQLAIFAYYLLVVGVVLQLIEYIRNPEQVD